MKSEYIPERFEKAVIVHALRLIWLREVSAPLILGIHGSPGEGKTYQCKRVLDNNGFEIFQISGGNLENKDAGEPARLIRDTYKEAQKYCKGSSSRRAALIIDDADAAFGNWGALYQYTINTQNLLAELMNLADYHSKGRDSERIPIYLTGNDFTKIYKPLKRAGRMVQFHWAPNESERLQFLYYLFPSLTEDECKEIFGYATNALKETGTISMAFFSDVKACLYDDFIWNSYINVKRKVIFGDPLSHLKSDTRMPVVTKDMITTVINKKAQEIEKGNYSYLG